MKFVDTLPENVDPSMIYCSLAATSLDNKVVEIPELLKQLDGYIQIDKSTFRDHYVTAASGYIDAKVNIGYHQGQLDISFRDKSNKFIGGSLAFLQDLDIVGDNFIDIRFYLMENPWLISLRINLKKENA